MSKTRNERFIRLDDKVMDSGYMDYGTNSYYCSNLITDMFENGFACRKKCNGTINKGMNIISCLKIMC